MYFLFFSLFFVYCLFFLSRAAVVVVAAAVVVVVVSFLLLICICLHCSVFLLAASPKSDQHAAMKRMQAHSPSLAASSSSAPDL